LRAKAKDDLEFTRKVFDLGEYDRAAKMCRHMIARLTNSPRDADIVNGFRELLILSMSAVYENSEPPEPILAEIERLFVGYLSVQDRASAAKTLLLKSQFLEDLDWPGAFAAGFKAIELFAGSADRAVLAAVRKVYDFLFANLDAEDTRFVSLCVEYGHFLEKPILDPHESVGTILEIDEALDGEQNATAIEIIRSFLYSRPDMLTTVDRERLRSRLAANYLFVQNYSAAIEECTGLLTGCDDASRLDYILWCGEAFLCLNRYATAAMYLREVIRALSDQPDDSRAVRAHGLLDQAISAASEAHC
jgi:tetratricopeptide (TPR) repeat protein